MRTPVCSVIYVRAESQERQPDGKVSNIPLSRKSEGFSIEFDNLQQANEYNEIFIRELRNYGQNIAKRIRSSNISGTEDREASS